MGAVEIRCIKVSLEVRNEEEANRELYKRAEEYKKKIFEKEQKFCKYEFSPKIIDKRVKGKYYWEGLIFFDISKTPFPVEPPIKYKIGKKSLNEIVDELDKA